VVKQIMWRRPALPVAETGRTRRVHEDEAVLGHRSA